MMRQGTFWAYNLRPPESKRLRQANVHCSNTEIAKTQKQKKSINRPIDNEEVVYGQNGILVTKRNKRMAQAAPQMSLEIITQREVSQNVKDKCPRLSLMLSENS